MIRQLGHIFYSNKKPPRWRLNSVSNRYDKALQNASPFCHSRPDSVIPAKAGIQIEGKLQPESRFVFLDAGLNSMQQYNNVVINFENYKQKITIKICKKIEAHTEVWAFEWVDGERAI